MADTIVLGTRGTDGTSVRMDLGRLIESRLLLQANSGAGKSWALRRLLEQSHGKVQHLVLDIEGEFHTLRERHDYVLAARSGGDTLAGTHTAALLVRRLLELGVSAICDLYELKAQERTRFVRLFLEALIDAPRSLWHPVLVVVDEAHHFCPQKGDAESAGAVIDLMTRGRKRGFCGVLASQRLSKLHKDAAAEANVKLIGRAALDVDLQRAAEELGLTTKEDRARLRGLPAGNFFAFGPGLSDQVIEIRVGDVETTHPRPGQRAAPIPPARAKVQKVLAQLQDLPKEAEQEAKTAAELRSENASLKRQLAARPTPPAPTPSKPIEVAILKDAQVKRLEKVADRFIRAAVAVQSVGHDLDGSAKEILAALAAARDPAAMRGERRDGPALMPAVVGVGRPAESSRPAPVVPRSGNGDARVTGPEQRILDALAWLEGLGQGQPEEAAVAFLAGYTVGGGAFNNPRGALRTAGLISYQGGGRLALTDSGRELARPPGEALTAEEIQARVLARLPGPEQRLLRALIAEYPKSLSNEELAGRAGYAPDGGAFNNPRGRLRTLGLVEYPDRGRVRARPVLFLEGA